MDPDGEGGVAGARRERGTRIPALTWGNTSRRIDEFAVTAWVLLFACPTKINSGRRPTCARARRRPPSGHKKTIPEALQVPSRAGTAAVADTVRRPPGIWAGWAGASSAPPDTAGEPPRRRFPRHVVPTVRATSTICSPVSGRTHGRKAVSAWRRSRPRGAQAPGCGVSRATSGRKGSMSSTRRLVSAVRRAGGDDCGHAAACGSPRRCLPVDAIYPLETRLRWACAAGRISGCSRSRSAMVVHGVRPADWIAGTCSCTALQCARKRGAAHSARRTRRRSQRAAAMALRRRPHLARVGKGDCRWLWCPTCADTRLTIEEMQRVDKVSCRCLSEVYVNTLTKLLLPGVPGGPPVVGITQQHQKPWPMVPDL